MPVNGRFRVVSGAIFEVSRCGRSAPSASTYDAPDPLHEIDRRVGLHEELGVRLMLQREYRGVAHLAGGNDDGNARPLAPDVLEYDRAADVGKSHIEHDGVGREIADSLRHDSAFASDLNLDSFQFQQRGDPATDGVI